MHTGQILMTGYIVSIRLGLRLGHTHICYS